MEQLYLAIDGDDVGSRLEYYLLTNNIKSLDAFSKQFRSSMLWLERRLEDDFKATIIFRGGDNLLLETNPRDFSMQTLEKTRLKFSEMSQRTISAGLGETPQKAYIALKLAKASGKNTIRQFEEFSNAK